MKAPVLLASGLMALSSVSQAGDWGWSYWKPVKDMKQKIEYREFCWLHGGDFIHQFQVVNRDPETHQIQFFIHTTDPKKVQTTWKLKKDEQGVFTWYDNIDEWEQTSIALADDEDADEDADEEAMNILKSAADHAHKIKEAKEVEVKADQQKIKEQEAQLKELQDFYDALKSQNSPK